MNAPLCFHLDETSTRVTLPSDSAGQVHVLLHDGHTVSVDCTELGVLEDPMQVGLSSLLQSEQCLCLYRQLGVDPLEYFLHNSLEGGPREHQTCVLLVLLDLLESDRARPEPPSPPHILLGLLPPALVDERPPPAGDLRLSDSKGLRLVRPHILSQQLLCGIPRARSLVDKVTSVARGGLAGRPGPIHTWALVGSSHIERVNTSIPVSP